MSKIYFQGTYGAYSHLAALSIEPKAEIIPCKTFDECFLKASKDSNSKIIIPESNRITGNIGIEYLIFEYRLNIYAEYFQKIEHNLLGLPGVKISEIKDVYRFVIVVSVSEVQIKKLVQQIEKQVDVIKAFYHTDKETIFLESALYKVKSSSLFEERQIQNIIKDSHANIVTVSPEFFVIQKTGFRKDTEKLREDLSKYGLLQFVRSGRISVTKAPMGISQILNNFKNQNKKNE